VSTNFYFVKKPCPHCGVGGTKLHIGKSSAGWCFALHVYPEYQIRTLQDWQRVFQEGEIQAESGEVMDVERFLEVVKERFHPKPHSKEWLIQNQAVPGPNNLARCKIAGNCVGHGGETWDLLIGDFS